MSQLSAQNSAESSIDQQQSSERRISRKPLPPDALTRLQKYAALQQESDNAGMSGHHPSFQPFWIRISVQLCFLFLFILILAALIVVDVYSQTHDGVSNASSKQYYLWTYIPTAIFTVCLAFWQRVDYRIRQLTPWIAMENPSGASADDSILLNYVSPTRPEICWFSFRHQHWPVFVSSLAVLIQTVLIVLSTALFTLAYRSPWETATFQTSTKILNTTGFLGSGRNATFSVSVLEEVYPPRAGFLLDAIRGFDMPYPFGSTPDFVYQQFHITHADLHDSAMQEAEVEVLLLDIECEPAALDIIAWQANMSTGCQPSYHVTLNVTSPSCVGIQQNQKLVEYGEDGQESFFAIAGAASSFDFEYSGCFYLGVGLAQQQGKLELPLGSDVTDCENYTLRSQWPDVTWNISRSKQWMCTGTPAITRALVAYNISELNSGTLPTIALNQSASKQSVSSGYDEVFQAWEGPIPSLRNVSVSSLILSERTLLPSFTRHVLSSCPNATQDELFRSDVFMTSATRLVRTMYMLIASLTFISSDDREVHGRVSIPSERLIARGILVHLAEALLLVLIALVVLLCLLLPRIFVMPADPVRLKGLAEILVSSPDFNSIFAGLGWTDDKTLRSAFGAFRFTTLDISSNLSRATSRAQSSVFKVTPIFTPRKENTFNASSCQVKWWRPWIIALPCRTAAASVVIAMIISLQVLLYVSGRRGGLVNVNIENNEHLAWSLIPASILVAISIYFGAVDFTYRTVAPYSRLKLASSGGTTIMAHFLSQTKLELIFTSLRDGQVALTSIATCTLLASFLTIIGSGVFSPANIPTSSTVSLSQTTWFRQTGSNDNGTSGNSGIFSSLVLESNLSYPAWTFEDLAFASVEVQQSSSGADVIASEARIRASIPAIRSSLNCTLYTENELPGISTMVGSIFTNLPGGPQCLIDTSISNQSLVEPDEFQYSGFNGWCSDSDLPCSWFMFANNTRPGCPLLNFFWGRQDTYENATSVSYARGLSCYEAIEKFMVDVTFLLPDFRVDSSVPPIPDDINLEIFSTELVAIPYVTMSSNWGSFRGWMSGEVSNDFFNAMNASRGISWAEYANPSHVKSIVAAIKRTHGIIRAQQYNAALRESTQPDRTLEKQLHDSTASESTYTGTLTGGQRWRLLQNKISTYLLCGVLAATLILATISSMFIDTKEILPKDPCTIAAMSSFLADSNILQDRNEMGRDNESHVKSTTYRLGWFERLSDGEKVFTLYRAGENEKIASLRGKISEPLNETTAAEGEISNPNATVEPDSILHDSHHSVIAP